MARAPDDVRIERPTMDDLDAMVDLWVALVADQRAHDTHLLADPNRATARDVLSQYVATERAFLARHRARDPPVGFVMYHVETGLYEEDARRGVLDNVYVVDGYRGRGIGSALLDDAEDALRDSDVDVIGISVMAGNDSARALYERRGYAAHRHVLEKPAQSDTHTKGGDES